MFHKRNELSLKVRCPHKEDGCEWEGEFGSLEEHTNRSEGGKCRYVEVNCPYSCGERFQRRSLEEHKSQHCPLRPSTCQYCNHKATYQEVITEHWPAHVNKVVPELQVTVKRLIDQNRQQEYQMMQQGDQIKQQEDLIKQQGDQIKQQGDQIKQQGDQIKQQGDQIKQQGDLIKQQGDQIKQQGDQIKQQEDQIKQQGDQIEQQVFPVFIKMQEFEEHKRKDNVWYSPPIFSHAGGYKMRLNVYANGFGSGKGTHVSVYVCLMRGEFDDLLQWPFNGKVSITLKKPLVGAIVFRYTNTFLELEKNIVLDSNVPDTCVTQPAKEVNECWGISTFISHKELGGYLKNNKLVFYVQCTIKG